jgi:hypothetical protein
MPTHYSQDTIPGVPMPTPPQESSAPIEPLATPAYPIRCPGVEVHENLLTLSIGPGHTGQKPHGGGKRRGITQWTPASRLRWMWLLAQVQWSAMPRPLWITLTYHGPDGYWPADPYRHLHQWLHVIQSNHGNMHYVWRLQWQARGAPHFHVILWPPNVTDFFQNFHYRQSLALSWHLIADPSSKPHRTYGAKIELLESYRHATRYIARYVAKESQDDITCAGTRRWGHSRNLPRSEVLSLELSVREALLVRRIVRRLVRSQARDRSRADRYVMTHSQIRVFASAHTVIQIIDYVMALEENRSGAYVPMA